MSSLRCASIRASGCDRRMRSRFNHAFIRWRHATPNPLLRNIIGRMHAVFLITLFFGALLPWSQQPQYPFRRSFGW